MAQGKSLAQEHQEKIAAIIASHVCNQYRWCMTCKQVVNDPAYHVASQLYIAGIRVVG